MNRQDQTCQNREQWKETGMSSSGSIDTELKRIVGKDGILPEKCASLYTYDGITPEFVVVPSSVQEMQDIMVYASKHKLSVMPAGSGTKLGIGNLGQETDFILSTTGLNKVVEYEPADLTVTVEAGIRLVNLQKELAQHRQFLPIDPPYSDKCTIGGIISSNSSGPLRHQHGTARNLVLGMKVLRPDGTVVKSGGKVVKNVAGYDTNKLYIGAFGTLGIITESTLKLAPLPTQQAILGVQFQKIQDAAISGLNIVRSQTLPAFVILCTNFSYSDLDKSKPIVLIGFGGEEETINWQLDSAQTLMEQNGAISVKLIDRESHESIRDAIQEFPAVENTSNTVLVKVNLKRTDVVEFAETVQTVTENMMVLLGNGVLYLKISVNSIDDIQSLVKTLTQLRQNVIDVQGNFIIESAPHELKRQMDVWGSVGSTYNLMKQVKTTFDSGNILNPGRFVSSI